MTKPVFFLISKKTKNKMKANKLSNIKTQKKFLKQLL